MHIQEKKVDGVLYIYDQLLAGGLVNKKNMAERLGVSDKTISRYLADIQQYLGTANKKVYIQYSRTQKGHLLTNIDKVGLSKKNILAIIETLIESRGFIKKEIEQLIQPLLTICTEEDRSRIKRFIANELEHYVSPKHGQPLINKIWFFNEAIEDQRMVKIYYTSIGKDGKVNSIYKQRTICPMGILFSEYYFYVVGYRKEDKYKKTIIYRLDRIKEYELLLEHFDVKYNSRFEEGDFRKHTYFMYGGESQNIQLRFTGESVEAIMDRLPTAQIIQETEGEYIISATVAISKGIIMWLLSQGENIEVLAPDSVRKTMVETIKKMMNMYQ